jgi:hypothetical protein
MLEIVQQRKYIQGFVDFVRTFGITETVTVNELNLVKANLDILDDRINNLGEKIIESYNRPKSATIIVNGKQSIIRDDEISYDFLINIAFPESLEKIYSVTYRNATEYNPDGIMLPNQIIKIRDGAIFNIAFTGNS